MILITQNGIQLKLKESTFTFLIDDINFYFSSEFYLNKFKNEITDYVFSESIKLKNKYKVKVFGRIFFAVSLYKKIEKRGFYIKNIATGREIKEDSLFKIHYE